MRYLLFLAASIGLAQGPGTCPGIPVGFSLAANAGRLNGFVPFPSSTYWHRDVTSATVDANNAGYVCNMSGGTDCTAGLGNQSILPLYPASINNGTGLVDGFFYHVVSGTQPRIPVIYDQPDAVLADSDPGPMPIPLGPIVQGSLTAGNPYPNWGVTGDNHVIVLDKDNCVLYELYEVGWDGHALHAAVGATYDLKAGDQQRPILWTSASVSGMPLFAGWLRDEELANPSLINHPISVSMAVFASGNFFPKHSFVAPASHHQYGGGSLAVNRYWWIPDENPFGGVWRMKPGYTSSSCTSSQATVLLNVMKKYGVILMDGGRNMWFYSAAGWNWDAPTTACFFSSVAFDSNGDNFEMISNPPVTADPEYATTGYNDSPGGRSHSPVVPNSTSSISGPTPTISGFACTSGCSSGHAAAGSTIKLGWTGANTTTRLYFVTPNVGAVVTNSATTVIQKTTTYSVYANNYYGQGTAATVTVTVP